MNATTPKDIAALARLWADQVEQLDEGEVFCSPFPTVFVAALPAGLAFESSIPRRWYDGLWRVSRSAQIGVVRVCDSIICAEPVPGRGTT